MYMKCQNLFKRNILKCCVQNYLHSSYNMDSFLGQIQQLTIGRPWWLSWMRGPTGDQDVAGSTTTEVGNILS